MSVRLGHLGRLARLVAVVAALALLTGGPGRGARIAAQGTGEGGGAALPLIGTPVPIAGTDGAEAARVTVTGIEDPWEDFEEGFEPPQSSRYVLLRLEIENTGARPYPTATFGLGLQDREGFLALPSYLPRSPEQVEADPDFPVDDVPPGETVSGVLGFQVLESAELARVTYQPAYDRLVFLADLTQAGDASAATGGDADAQSSPAAGDEDGDGASSGSPSGDDDDDADTDADTDTDSDTDDGASGGPGGDGAADDGPDTDTDTDTDAAAVDVSDEDCAAIQAWYDDITPALEIFGATFADIAADDPVTAETLEGAAADLREAADDIRDSDPPDLLGESADLLADALDVYADAYLDVAEANDEISAADLATAADTSAADELINEVDVLTAPAFEACGIDA